MKKVINSFLLITAIVLVFSCADESLDPLQTKAVKKGTLLALRGTQLDNLYWNEVPGASFFANRILGTETFDFDAEYLAEDVNTLSSFDIYVIKNTVVNDKVVSERVLLQNVPASQFKTTSDYKGPWVSVSIKLTDILAKLGVTNINDPATADMLFDLYSSVDPDTGERSGGISIECDLNLTDGTTVLASQIVSGGLFQSDQFYPAQILTYAVQDVDDYRPFASTSLRGQYVSNTSRPVLPLKDGAKDTLNITFDQAIANIPDVSLSPNIGVLGAVVRMKDKDGKDIPNKFYVPYTAGAGYTGDVTVTISGGISDESGVLNGLVQNVKKAKIAVDNLEPQLVKFTTGKVGKGQTVTLKIDFNEKMGTAPKLTFNVTDTKIDAVTDVKTTISADGLSATYSYEYKDSDGDAVHGTAEVTVSGGKDLAGNAFGGTSANLVIDLGTPPTPTVTLNPTQYDWGTQIKWTIDQSTDGNNPGGSTTGTVYFVAVTSGAAAPTGFVNGESPAFTGGSSAKQTGSVAVSSGSSGSVYTAFTANGTLDVYFVFVSSTGNVSAISSPVTVTMN